MKKKWVSWSIKRASYNQAGVDYYKRKKKDEKQTNMGSTCPLNTYL